MTTRDPRSIAAHGDTWLTDSRAYNLIWLGRWIERASSYTAALAATAEVAGDEAAFMASCSALANAWGLPDHSPAVIREAIANAIRMARDDASQVGPLELIRELNSLLSEFDQIWPSDGRAETISALQRLHPALDDIASAIEARWFHKVTAR